LSDRDSRQASERLADAFAYAVRLHAGQRRNGTEIPYVSHLMAVAALVQENGGGEDQVIAALLHDGPEDQGGEVTLAEIEARFGPRVATIVRECSDTFEEPKPPWLERKRDYLRHLETASEETLLVSVADKVHNLGCIARDFREHGDELWGRFNADRDGVVWYYGKLLKVYDEREQPQLESLIGEMTRSLAELNTLIEESRSAEPLPSQPGSLPSANRTS